MSQNTTQTKWQHAHFEMNQQYTVKPQDIDKKNLSSILYKVPRIISFKHEREQCRVSFDQIHHDFLQARQQRQEVSILLSRVNNNICHSQRCLALFLPLPLRDEK